MLNWIRAHLLNGIAALALTVITGAAGAGENKSPSDANPTFGNRTDKPDGSAALTIGRRLPTEWETKVGTDVSLGAPAGTAVSDDLLRGGATDRSSGAIWGNVTMPGLAPLGFDKTSLEARLDAGKDEGKLGATLSRSVPLNPDLSLTWQNSYSVRQSLANGTSVTPATTLGIPLNASTSTALPGLAPAWAMDETIRLNADRPGTTFSAGAGSSTADAQWHNKLSVEQTLLGPLKLTASVEDAGTAAAKKSITAGFKRVW
jgi:hypothetical protein